MGVLYDCGLGVPQDRITALMWYDIAAMVSGEDAAARYKDFAAQMTAAEATEAEKRAQTWLRAFHARGKQW